MKIKVKKKIFHGLFNYKLHIFFLCFFLKNILKERI